MFLPVHPQTDLIAPSPGSVAATRPPPPKRTSVAGLSQLELQILSAYLGVPAPRLAAQLSSGQSLARVIVQNGGTVTGFRRFLALFRLGGRSGGLFRGGHRRRR
jgi:hypothetical protein